MDRGFPARRFKACAGCADELAAVDECSGGVRPCDEHLSCIALDIALSTDRLLASMLVSLSGSNRITRLSRLCCASSAVIASSLLPYIFLMIDCISIKCWRHCSVPALMATMSSIAKTLTRVPLGFTHV